jgi:hypothetical protein
VSPTALAARASSAGAADATARCRFRLWVTGCLPECISATAAAPQIAVPPDFSGPGQILTLPGDLPSFSVRPRGDDEFRSERDLRFYRIRDEALCLNGFHHRASALELSRAIEGYARSNGDFRDAVLAFDIFEQAFGSLSYPTGTRLFAWVGF